jgi:hypothetical protein
MSKQIKLKNGMSLSEFSKLPKEEQAALVRETLKVPAPDYAPASKPATKTFVGVSEVIVGIVCLSHAMEELTAELSKYETNGVLVNPTPKQKMAMEKRRRISELVAEVNNLAMEFTDTMRENAGNTGMMLIDRGAILAKVARGLVFIAPNAIKDTEDRLTYVLDKNRDKRIK